MASTTAPTATGPRATSGTTRDTSRPAPIASGASTPSWTTTPTANHAATSTQSPKPWRDRSRNAPYAASAGRRSRRRPAGVSQHLQPGDPLGLQDARDGWARSAGTGSRGRAPASRRRARAPGASGRRRRSRPAGSSRERPRVAGATRPGGRGRSGRPRGSSRRALSVRSSRRSRSIPRRTRSAASRSAAGAPRGRRGSGVTSRSPYATLSRYDAAVAVAVTAAALADLLIGMPPGPSPDRTPSTETRRSAGTVDPAVTRAATPTASQVVRSSPRRVSTPGSVASARSWAVSSTSAPRAPRTIGQLDGDVDDQRADRHPGDGVVGGPEGEGRPRVPLRSVGDPGRELEDRRRDQHPDRDAFGRVQARARERLAAAGRRAAGRPTTA